VQKAEESTHHPLAVEVSQSLVEHQMAELQTTVAVDRVEDPVGVAQHPAAT
jgi:hypothetical protein